MKKFFVNNLIIAAFVALAAIVSSCNDDEKDPEPGKDSPAACALKAHPDSTFVWDSKTNKCVATYIYEPAIASCAAKTHADSTFAWDNSKKKCVATYKYEAEKAACAAKEKPDYMYTWENNKCVEKYVGPTDAEKIAALQTEIAGLVADSARVLKAARAALIPAVTVPDDWSAIWNLIDADPSVPRGTFLDTLNYIIKQSEEYYKRWGTEKNLETMGIYLALGEEFRTIVAELKTKRAELKVLQNKKSSAIASKTNIQNKARFDNQVAMKNFTNAKNAKDTIYVHFARSALHNLTFFRICNSSASSRSA